jgi:hypothetical protein
MVRFQIQTHEQISTGEGGVPRTVFTFQTSSSCTFQKLVSYKDSADNAHKQRYLVKLGDHICKHMIIMLEKLVAHSFLLSSNAAIVWSCFQE